MSDQLLIFKAKSVAVEAIAIIGLGLFIVSFLTVLDIRFHDFYVLPIIEECYPENQSEFCQSIRLQHGLPTGAQVELGDIYWVQLAAIGIFVGLILAIVRALIAGLMKFYLRRKIRPATILMIITYGLIGSSLFFFGILDTFYYWFQGENVPEELAWLNNAGIFQQTREWTGNPDVVEIEDLYLTNIVGLVIIGFFVFVTMVLYANSGLSPNGIA